MFEPWEPNKPNYNMDNSSASSDDGVFKSLPMGVPVLGWQYFYISGIRLELFSSKQHDSFRGLFRNNFHYHG